MLPFFRKIRFRLAAENQLLKYTRYAIGEIVLVVIGILIALQVNNWNENRKAREAFDLVLEEVERELVINIYDVRNNLNTYARQDSILIQVLVDSISVEELKLEENQALFNAIYMVGKAQVLNESFLKLKQIGSTNQEQESIFKQLTNLNRRSKILEDLEVWMLEVMKENRRSIEKYAWYHDWSYGRYKQEALIDYFANDHEYKNAATKYMQVAHNYRTYLEVYDVDANSVYQNIHAYLNSIHSRNEDELEFQYEVNNYAHYTGAFVPYFKTSDRAISTDSIVIGLENGKLFLQPYPQSEINPKRQIIPMSASLFRTNFAEGFYRLKLNDAGEVKGLELSRDSNLMRMKKIR